MLLLAHECRQEVQDWPCFVLAVLFHDLVYEPTKDNNEEASALAMLDHLRGTAAADVGFLRRAAASILCTKKHNPGESVSITHEVYGHIDAVLVQDSLSHLNDVKLLIDCDMAILAADSTRYAAYCDQVREENSHLSDDEFISARLGFLTGLLGAPSSEEGEASPPLTSLFLSPTFQSLLEHRVQPNIGAEIKKLQGCRFSKSAGSGRGGGLAIDVAGTEPKGSGDGTGAGAVRN